MKKITILALHLGYGGIERFIVNLANSLCNDYEVEIVSTYKLDDKPAFNINDNIRIKYLINDLKPNKKELFQALKHFRLIKTIKEIIKSCKILRLKKKLMVKYIKKCDSDIFISTRDIHNKWLGKYGSKKSLKIATEHNYHNNNKKYIAKIVKSVKKIDYFVLVSKELKDFYQSKVDCPCFYIPNSIDKLNKKSNLTEKTLITIGRLEKIKGYSDLIDIFNLVHKKCPDWNLKIVGDGKEFQTLKDKIKYKNLEKNIFLCGYKSASEINKLLTQSSIYLMTSFSESFGLVLIEAMASGVPVVSFTNSGSKEIVSNNWDGYLIDNRNKEKFAKKVIELINNENRRIIMGNNSYKKASNYLADNIKQEWVKLIEK
jgi:N-acetylglucosaminyldiphosphoundecaprenol N-acetyl-beta-D-mannosaminyltransferase